MNIKSIKRLNKKGVLGLDTVKSVFVWFLVISILAIVIVLALVSLRTPVENIDKTTDLIRNETILDLDNNTIKNFAQASSDAFRNGVCSIQVVKNITDGKTIVAANYTLSNSGCSIIGSVFLNASGFNGSNVLIDYTSVFSNPQTNNLIRNVSSALSDDFFDQTGTIFAILIVIVIILAIAIIIAVVTRFGGGAGGGGASGEFSGGGSRSFGGNTLTGS